MNYGLAIITAIFTFASPCVLPLLPIYISYFAGAGGDSADDTGESTDLALDEETANSNIKATRKKGRWRTFINTLAFCLAISIFFMALFVSAAALQSTTMTEFLEEYRDKIYIICGIILILLGLKFMGYLSLPFLDKTISIKAKTDNINVINAFVLGFAFSFSMGACAFGFIFANLGMMMANSSFIQGLIVGVLFTVTLDVLFIVCALLIDQLKGMFSFIRRHYRVINLISGAVLVLLGISMALGLLEELTLLLM